MVGAICMEKVVIESVEIERFRGIRKTAKPIELNKLTVIIGRNDSGKTTLLESIYVLSSKKMIPPGLYPDALFREAHKLHNYRYLLYNYDTTSNIILKYTLHINDKYIIKHKILTYMDDLARILVNRYYLYPIYSKAGEIKNFRIDTTYRSDRAIPISSIIILCNEYFMNSLDNYIFKNWDVIESKGLHKRIVEKYINPSLPEKIYTELTQRPDGIAIRKEIVIDKEVIPKYIRVKDLGDGIYRTLMNVLYIEFVNPSIILWDDFGSYMHPSLIENTLKYIVNSVATAKKQYIITTHSIDTLYYLHKVIEETSNFDPNWLSLLVLYKDKADILDYELVDYSGFDDLMSSGIDPRLLARKLSI